MSTPITPSQIRAEHDRPQRTKRIPFGVPKTKLGVNLDIPGYHLFWCNDTENRIAGAQAGGYEFVAPKEIGEVREDSQVRRLVGTDKYGSPLYAYLMKIKQEWHQEDKAKLAEIDDQFENAIRRGKLFEQAGDARYDAGIKFRTNRT